MAGAHSLTLRHGILQHVHREPVNVKRFPKLTRVIVALALLIGMFVAVTAVASSANAYTGNPAPPVVGYDDPVPMDYNGDGFVEPTIVRNTGTVLTWWIYGGPTVNFGSPGDIPVPGKYCDYIYSALDCDGDRDQLAVWHPATATWYILSWGTGHITAIQWGLSTDIPVPGDYTGTSQTAIAVFRPSNSTVYWASALGKLIVNTFLFQFQGQNGVQPSPFFVFPVYMSALLYNTAAGGAPHKPANPEVYSPNIDHAYCLTSSGYPSPCNVTRTYGLPGDVGFSFDFGRIYADTAGVTTISNQQTVSVWRQTNETFYIACGRANDSVCGTQQWGLLGDIPVPGPYNGNHATAAYGSNFANRWTNLAVYRPCNATWYILNTNRVGWTQIPWGDATSPHC